MNEKFAPLPEKLLTLAFDAFTPVDEKLFIGSENVTVTGIKLELVVVALVVVSTTVGPPGSAAARELKPTTALATIASDVSTDTVREVRDLMVG